MPVLIRDITPIARLFIILFICSCGMPGCSLVSFDTEEQLVSLSEDAIDLTPRTEPVTPDPSHVYVYFIHGLDPCDCANLRGVEQYCHELGFANTVFVALHQGADVVSHVECTKAHDANARIVIYGYSAGSDIARRTVNTLHDRDGIDVDLLMYVSAITLIDCKSARPEFVGKIVHIRDGGKLIPGMQLIGAENYRFSDLGHFSTPMDSRTLAIFKSELEQQALLVNGVK